MKPDFLIYQGTYHTTNVPFVTVHGVSILGGAMITYYHGGPQREHNDEDIVTMTPDQFKSFREYCDKASANKFDFIFVLK
jgi:hypothetical protein